LDCFAEGETIVYAIQPGNQNWWQTTKIYKKVKIAESQPTGIEDNLDNNQYPITKNRLDEVYDLQGRKQGSMRPGLNILRIGDGTTRKVVVK
jgi:hypothetical protein